MKLRQEIVQKWKEKVTDYEQSENFKNRRNDGDRNGALPSVAGDAGI